MKQAPIQTSTQTSKRNHTIIRNIITGLGAIATALIGIILYNKRECIQESSWREVEE